MILSLLKQDISTSSYGVWTTQTKKIFAPVRLDIFHSYKTFKLLHVGPLDDLTRINVLLVSGNH